MATLSWAAGVIGHYANSLVAQGGVDSFYTNNGSYNGVFFPVEYVVVQNYDNALSVQLAYSSGLNISVPPFANSAIKINNEQSITISNPNGKNVSLVFLDAAHATAYLDSYTNAPSPTPDNDNIILLHFASKIALQSGNLSKTIFEVLPDTTFAGAGKFSGGAITSVSGSVNGGGVRITGGEQFDFTKNFTIDFWINVNLGAIAVGDTSIMSFTNPSVVDSNLLGINYTGAGAGSWRIFATLSASVLIPVGYGHVAIVRFGNNINFYVNGSIVNSAVISAAGNALHDILTLGGSSTVVKSTPAVYSEFRFRQGAVWTRNFTPPTLPYI